MTTQVPYSFQKFTDFYDFTTENGIDYRVKFADGAFLFVDFPSHLTVYEVAISPIRLGRYTTPPQDPRAEATFIKIFKDFLSEHQNSIVYVCDTNDNKQAARNRKFDMGIIKINLKMLRNTTTPSLLVIQKSMLLSLSIFSIHSKNH
jgi:Family of unknown function (DUF6169)